MSKNDNREFFPNTTQIPNWLFTAEVMGALNLNELRLLLAVMRKTYGWFKHSDEISNSQVEAMTGMRNDKVEAARLGLQKKIGLRHEHRKIKAINDKATGGRGCSTKYFLPEDPTASDFSQEKTPPNQGETPPNNGPFFGGDKTSSPKPPKQKGPQSEPPPDPAIISDFVAKVRAI